MANASFSTPVDPIANVQIQPGEKGGDALVPPLELITTLSPKAGEQLFANYGASYCTLQCYTMSIDIRKIFELIGQSHLNGNGA